MQMSLLRLSSSPNPKPTRLRNSQIYYGRILILKAKLGQLVELPELPMARRSTYRKVRDRAAYAFALVSVAAARDLGPSIIAITSGEEGAVVLAGGERHHVPARRVPVVYDIGAGDAFHAGFVAAHLAGMSPTGAARFAADAAALRISRGVSQPGPDFAEVAALADRPC